MIRPIPERHPYDGRDTDIVLSRLFAVIDKVCREAHNARTPAIKAKHFVGEIDDLPSLGVGEFGAATRTGTLADELGTELLVEFCLEGGNLFGGGGVLVGERGETEDCGRRGPRGAVCACVKGHGAASDDGRRAGLSGAVVERVEGGHSRGG